MNEELSRGLFERDIAGLSERLIKLRNWEIVSATFPILEVVFNASDRQPFRVRFTCTDWNEQPPSVALLERDGSFLSKAPSNPSGVFHQGPHPNTGRPFICMAGSKEYHTHPSHTGDYWDAYRSKDAYTLGGILTQVWRAWLRG